VILLGLDENGLGPRLGPLVGTCVALDVGPSYDRARLRRAGKRLGLEDSKASTSFGQMAHGESAALALVAEATGTVPRTADELLGAVSLDAPAALRAPCPGGGSNHQCWSEPVALPAFGGDVGHGRRLLGRLRRSRVRILRLRSVMTCAGVFNARTADGTSKVVVNLENFERLLADARAALAPGEPVTAICGMVGGIRSYPAYVRRIPRDSMEVLEEGRGRCAYRVPSLGEVAFEVAADDRHLPVALASMVGKYLREVAMERQNRFYARELPDAPRASGYHDPVTRRFILASTGVRARLGVLDRCFERTS
jgi:ribonuclease HII